MHLRFLVALALACVCSPAMAVTQSAEPFGTALAAFIAAPVSVAAVILFLQVPVLGLFQRVGNWFVLAVAVMLCVGLGGQALAASDGTEPDPVLTPGAVRTTDLHEICGHSTREFRHVTITEKIAARRAYGILPPRDGWCAAGKGCDTEIDHLVPLTVGGGNPAGSIANLWPMRGDGPNNYHVKDRCEAAAGRALCAGKLTVQQAQDMFRTDWIGHCAAFMGEGTGR